MTLEETQGLAKLLLRKHGLARKGWRFQFDNAKRRGGLCRYARKEISLSRGFVSHVPDEEVLDTLLHEIAHALVGKKHRHDRVWKAKALAIGCSGKRCHSYHFTKPKWFLKCSKECFAFPRHRRPRGGIQGWRCRTCQAPLQLVEAN